MTHKQMNIIMTVALVVVCGGLIAGAYATNRLFTSQAASLLTLKAKSSALAQEQVDLTKAKQQVKQYASLSQVVDEIVPQQKNDAQIVAQIVDIASRHNISLGSLSFPASTLGNTPLGTSASTSASNAAGSTAATANPNSKTSKLSQLQPVVGIPGVYYAQVTVQSAANDTFAYSDFIGFLSDLEHNRSTAIITGVSIQPSPKDQTAVSFSLTINEYVKP